MIPTKILVYRGPNEDTLSKTVQSTTRRKKSTGELFQKGYRVRMSHGLVPDKEDQDSFCFSLGGCFHMISYWGKITEGITLKWKASSLIAVYQLEQVQACNAASLAHFNRGVLLKPNMKIVY